LTISFADVDLVISVNDARRLAHALTLQTNRIAPAPGPRLVLPTPTKSSRTRRS
jgi:hypothetical protein